MPDLADPADIDFSDIPNAAPAPTGRPVSGPAAVPAGATPGPTVGQGKSLLDMPLPELDPADQQAMRMIMSGDPRVAAAGQHRLAISPAYQARTKQVEAMSKYAAGMQDKRLAGENVLGPVAQLIHTVANAPDEDIANATGPQNTAEIAEKGPTYLPIPGTHIPIPWMEAPNTNDPRTDMPITGTLTHTHRQAILNPDDEKAQKAWDLQQRLLHNVKGITTAVSASLGGGGAGQTTNAKMAAYDTAAMDFMHASTPEGREKILGDLVGLIQQDFNLTPEEAHRVVMHHFMGFERQAYPARAQGVPREAVNEIIRNQSDPQHIRDFNSVFNKNRPGLAEYIIQQHKGQPPPPPPPPPPQPININRYGAGPGGRGAPAPVVPTVTPAATRAISSGLPSTPMARPPTSLTDPYGYGRYTMEP